MRGTRGTWRGRYLYLGGGGGGPGCTLHRTKVSRRTHARPSPCQPYRNLHPLMRSCELHSKWWLLPRFSRRSAPDNGLLYCSFFCIGMLPCLRILCYRTVWAVGSESSDRLFLCKSIQRFEIIIIQKAVIAIPCLPMFCSQNNRCIAKKTSIIPLPRRGFYQSVPRRSELGM